MLRGGWLCSHVHELRIICCAERELLRLSKKGLAGQHDCPPPQSGPLPIEEHPLQTGAVACYNPDWLLGCLHQWLSVLEPGKVSVLIDSKTIVQPNGVSYGRTCHTENTHQNKGQRCSVISAEMCRILVRGPEKKSLGHHGSPGLSPIPDLQHLSTAAWIPASVMMWHGGDSQSSVNVGHFVSALKYCAVTPQCNLNTDSKVFSCFLDGPSIWNIII